MVQSIAMYGAPVWHEKLVAGHANTRLLQGAQRRLAIRAIRGYRTISIEAACVVAGIVPWMLAAGMYAESYRGKVARRKAGLGPLTAQQKDRQRLHLRRLYIGK